MEKWGESSGSGKEAYLSLYLWLHSNPIFLPGLFLSTQIPMENIWIFNC